MKKYFNFFISLTSILSYGERSYKYVLFLLFFLFLGFGKNLPVQYLHASTGIDTSNARKTSLSFAKASEGAAAESLPEVRLSNQEFTSFSGFTDMYDQFHTAEQFEDFPEIVRRVCQYPEVDCEANLTIEKLQKLDGITVVKQGTNKQNQEQIRAYLDTLIELERSLLGLENSMTRQQNLSLSFSDEPSENAFQNSPFDLAREQRAFDATVFGEHASEFQPKFITEKKSPSTSSGSETENSEFILESEMWQNQQRENLNLPGSSAVEQGSSFSGMLYQVSETLKFLVRHSLAAGKNTKHMWELPFSTSALPTGYTGAGSVSVPSVSNDIPEVQISPPSPEGFGGLRAENWSIEIETALRKQLKQTDCTDAELRSVQSLKFSEGFERRQQCELARELAWYEQQKVFTQRIVADQSRKNAHARMTALEKIRGFFSTLQSQLETVRDTLTDINNHAAK